MDTDSNPSTEKKEPDPRHTPTVDKKVRVGMNRALAILAVHERKQVSYHVDYRSIAPRYGMGAAALRKLYCWWTKGRIELPAKAAGQPASADDGDLIGRARGISRRDLALTLSAYEGAVYSAEQAFGQKGRLGVKHKKGEPPPDIINLFKEVHFLRRQVMTAMELVAIADEGFDEYLQAQQAALTREKPANPAVAIPENVGDAVRVLSDHDRGLLALREAKAKAHPVEAQVTPASNG